MSIEKLLSIASDPLAPSEVPITLSVDFSVNEKRSDELRAMLSAKNGFYAFEGALHVFPCRVQLPQAGPRNIESWNEKALWRDWYQEKVNGLLFFAEDIFGGQFAIRGEEIVSFDPESGETEILGASLEEWAAQLLLNYRGLTGYPLAQAWQLVNGRIPEGRRLLPKIPFILGGQYHEANLFAVDAVEGMRYRGELWQQLRDLPDGAQVRLKPLPSQ